MTPGRVPVGPGFDSRCPQLDINTDIRALNRIEPLIHVCLARVYLKLITQRELRSVHLQSFSVHGHFSVIKSSTLIVVGGSVCTGAAGPLRQ